MREGGPRTVITTAIVTECLHRAISSPPYLSHFIFTTALCGGDSPCPDFTAEETKTQKARTANPGLHREPTAELVWLWRAVLGRLVLWPHRNGGRRQTAGLHPPVGGSISTSPSSLARASWLSLCSLHLSLLKMSGKTGHWRRHDLPKVTLLVRDSAKGPVSAGKVPLAPGCAVPLGSAARDQGWCAGLLTGLVVKP